MSYLAFQNSPSSEKITLAILYASKQLMGWSLHSGSIYKLQGLSISGIASIEDSGSLYTEVNSIGSVTQSKYFHDRENQTVYLRTSGSDNPNGRFIVLTQKLYFSNIPISLPHDLNEGYDVFWEPLIKSTSSFGVGIDTINQISDATEGSGSLTLHNDNDFWPSNFDKLYFENKSCFIYSYSKELSPTEAKLIYRGQVEKKSFNSTEISFSLTDIMSELRSPISLGTIGDLGLRTGSDLSLARQRLILGRVFGHVPVNTDQVLDGYPITGLVSIDYGTNTLNGSSTQFLKELSPDDRILLDDVEYTISTVSSNTAATITENYASTSNLVSAQTYLIPDQPKRHINRTWNVAGHALCEPVTQIANGSSITRLILDTNKDIYTDDWIYIGPIGSGELVQVESVTGTKIVNLRTSVASVPPIGTLVTRPAVQNVRIDDVSLVYYSDYLFDASTATLTLLDTAEANSSPIRSLTSNLVFNSTSTVTGSGLKNSIKPGYMVGVAGNADFFEVLSVDSDTQLTLRTTATFTATANGRYKPLIFDPSNNVLTMDVLGKTDDGLSSGSLLKTAPSIVRALLIDAGLEDRIDDSSFESSESPAPMHIGLVSPETFSQTDAPIYRDVINSINKSVFGSLIQDNDFKLGYTVLQPTKATSSLKLDESDILSLEFESTAENLVKSTIVKYRNVEYDYLTKQTSISSKQKTSQISNYIVKTSREKIIQTNLVSETDAERSSARWSFILENGAGKAKIKTKLQAIQLEIGSVIEVTHPKFFKRIGLSDKSRLFLVESVKKSGFEVEIDVVDLSNAFSRVAAINDLTTTFSESTDNEKLYGGFYTDQYGLIDNDSESFGTNLIW